MIACLFTIAASALPSRPGTFTVTQPDGTVLTLRLVGDEHFHYYVNVDNGQPLCREADGTFRVLPREEMTRLESAATIRRTMANELRKERMATYQRLAGVRTDLSEIKSSPRKVGGFNGALIGQKKGLVILVNFADLDHRLNDPRQAWDDAFNKPGYSENGHIGSVHDYFYDQSYGQFDLEFDVVGPVTVSKKMSYYGQNNSRGSDAHAAEMVVEACQLVNNAVDFRDYDWDGDGEVDQVYVIYAGYGESSGAPSETIWPHEYWLRYGYGQALILDGVKIDTYACSCELSGRSGIRQTGIGTACHEFSHCIGFPDFYDTDYSGAFGMDVMSVLSVGAYNGPDGGSQVPCGYTSYERWMAGWLEPEVLSEGCFVTAMPNIGDDPVAYVIYNEANKDEYFLLENRQAKRWFSYTDSYVGQHGLLVLHVDYDYEAWENNAPNNDPSHQRMTIIPAGRTFGTYNSNYKSWYSTSNDYQSMTFPGRNRMTELTNESHYNCGGKLFNKNIDGTYSMNKPITDIEENSADGTISFVFNDGPDDGNRWSVTLEAGSGNVETTAWTQQEANERIVLPAATPAYEGWRFAGWSAEAVSVTKERPSCLFAAGEKYRPLADVVLYAVYGYCDQSGYVDEYFLTDEIRDGHRYVFATKGASTANSVYAISADSLQVGVIVKYPKASPVQVDFSGEIPAIATPTADLVWTANIGLDGMSLINGDNYLVMNNNGMGLSLSATNVYWDTTYGMYGLSSGGSNYFIHPYGAKFALSATKNANSRVFAYEEKDFFEQDVTYATTVPSGLLSITPAVPATSVVYDLQGRKISATVRGIYIQNGRKIIR